MSKKESNNQNQDATDLAETVSFTEKFQVIKIEDMADCLIAMEQMSAFEIKPTAIKLFSMMIVKFDELQSRLNDLTATATNLLDQKE